MTEKQLPAERLSKRVAQQVPCSRREAEQYIEGGWVRVDGVVVEAPQHRVSSETISIAPDASLMNLAPVSLILHKPVAWLDGLQDLPSLDNKTAKPHKVRPSRPESARTLLSPATHFAKDTSGVRVLKRHFSHLQAVVPLETGASGLLVFTQDWRTQRKLNDDLASMEHELMVSVAGEASVAALDKITQLLRDARTPLPQAKASISSSSAAQSQLRFAIKGAHPGLAAYLCEKAGLEILAMRRIRLGRVALGDLPVGQWRYLAAHERF